MNSEYCLISFNEALTAEEKSKLNEEKVTFSKSKSLIGGEELTSLIFLITPILIVQVTKVIIEIIKNKKLINFKYKDMEVNNISASSLIKILNLLAQDSINHNNTTELREKIEDISNEDKNIS